MIFRETALKGAFVIEPELKEDERGFFARAWCQRELAAHGLNPNDASDANQVGADGYTNLEHYLNSLVP